MSSPAARLRRPLLDADTPRRLAPLLRELGFEPLLRRVPRRDWRLFALGGAEGLKGLVVGGERAGVILLVAELDSAPEARIVARLARRLRAHNPAVSFLLLAAGPGYRSLAFGATGLDGTPRHAQISRASPREADLELLHELRARDGEGGVEHALRVATALDRVRLGDRFFREFRAIRNGVARAWTGLPADAREDREQLALLLLSRLMFLYFLQRDGHLLGEADYLRERFRRWRSGRRRGSFYRSVLTPLFFAALNTRPHARSAGARALGPLPYLNGGLFDRHALERRWPKLHLNDDALEPVFRDLLDRYRFTSREDASAEAEAGIDPEMLGRVFEGLMNEERRGETGTFYTPASVVDRVVSTALVAHLVSRCALREADAEAVVGGEAAALEPEQRRCAERVLADARVLDPACGSGAFLLGALSRMSGALEGLAVPPGSNVVHASATPPPAGSRAQPDAAVPHADEIRRTVAASSLFGVDLQADAALLCALRLWLALAAHLDPSRPPPPLPNLDRRIRQGDALLDPLDLLQSRQPGSGEYAASLNEEVRRRSRVLAQLSAGYGDAEPAQRIALQRRLCAAEAALAQAWLRALASHAARREAELKARSLTRDLFGELDRDARLARAALPAWSRHAREIAVLAESLAELGELPFFSFPIHFSDARAGFDLVLSNPPWLRSHRWPAATRRLVRARYAVCNGAGAENDGAGQVDLALVFLERSLRLLSPGGTLGMLLPAKTIRSGYGGAARALLVRETAIHSIRDHSLDQRSIFRADAFAMEVVATRVDRTEAAPDAASSEARAAGDDATSFAGRASAAYAAGGAATASSPPVRVTMIRRKAPPLTFHIRQAELPLDRSDARSLWLLAPPACAAALRRMQAAGPPLAARADLPIRRGIVTGANDVLVIRTATPRIGDLAEVEAEGYRRVRKRGGTAAEAARYRALVEASALRPVLRGSGVSAWSVRAGGHVVWCHRDDATPTDPPPRVAAYLERHRRALRRRTGRRDVDPLGAVGRLAPETLGPKVVWQDLSDRLQAATVPARVHDMGLMRPLVPLNTVYFVPVPDEEAGLLLAALLNSLPVRTFARAIAERAKDARFRFMGRCIGSIPLPPAWHDGAHRSALLATARRAASAGGIDAADDDALTALVARLYRLSVADVDALESFGAWLDSPRVEEN